jgi:citrate lyase subunit beta/citryl-CoA lyase
MNGAPIITSLYVPGDRPERFDKAVASGTQLVILDLEDAVAPDRKTDARVHVGEWLRLHVGDVAPAVEVRVNAGNDDDLTCLAAVSGDFGIRVPKVESPDDIDRVVDAMGRDVRVTALIETALGIEAVLAIASHPMVTSLTVGEADLASDLGTADRAVLNWAEFRVLTAARAARKPPPVAPVYTDIEDLEGLAADTANWRRMGFVGRAAIHPSQVPVIAAAFRPTEAELAWAREVLAAVGAGGVSTLKSGEMVDPAMLGRAESIVALDAAVRRDERR